MYIPQIKSFVLHVLVLQSRDKMYTYQFVLVLQFHLNLKIKGVRILRFQIFKVIYCHVKLFSFFYIYSTQFGILFID